MSEPGTVEWRFDMSGAIGTVDRRSGANRAIYSSPTVVDGTAYVGSYDGDKRTASGDGRGYVYAVDTETGNELWHFETKGKVSSSPTVVDGTVYITSYGGYRDSILHAVDAESGSELWHFETKSWVSSSPTVVDGTVYIGDNDGHLYALHPESGNCWRRFRKYKKMNTSPMMMDETVYVGSQDTLYAVDMESENVLWRLDELTRSELTVVDGSIYGGDGYLFYRVDAESGNVLWESDMKPRMVASLPTVVDGTVFVPEVETETVFIPELDKRVTRKSDQCGYISAVDTEDGSELWRFETNGVVKSSPTVVDGMVYVGDLNGYLYAVDAESGNELWRFENHNAVGSPIVVDGTVYFGSADGHLCAVSAGVEGASEDSRVRQGIINHHHNLERRNQTTAAETELEEQGSTKESDSEEGSILDTINSEFDEVGE